MARLSFSPEQHPGFFASVKARVDQGLAQRGKTRFGDRTIWLKAGLYAACASAAYALAVWGGLGGRWSLVFATLYGMGALLLAFPAHPNSPPRTRPLSRSPVPLAVPPPVLVTAHSRPPYLPTAQCSSPVPLVSLCCRQGD